MNRGVTPSWRSMIVLQLWPAEGYSRSVIVAVHLVCLPLRGECFCRVVERGGCSNLKRFGAESLDSSLTGEGSDDLATLICAECRYMLSVKTVRPRIHLIENACGRSDASCTSSHASQSTDRVLEPPLCRLLPQITAQRLLGKLTSDRGKRLATGHTGCSTLVAGNCKCKEQFCRS